METAVRARTVLATMDPAPLVSAAGQALRDTLERVRAEFFEAMDHDFNTAGALGKIFELARETNRFLDLPRQAADRAVVEEVLAGFEFLLQLLGFVPTGLPAETGAGVPAEVLNLAQERQAARASGDWARADVLRRAILERGFVVEDRTEGPRVKPRS
jgi:cysteinyl-tRNA synthetase